MKMLSSLERIILETIEHEKMDFSNIVKQSGLQEKTCYFIIQKLIIKKLIIKKGELFQFNIDLQDELKKSYFSEDTKKMEQLELVESIMEFNNERTFKMKRVAMNEKDFNLFNAMLSNLESFLKDIHDKTKKETPVAKRKVIFWGMESSQNIINNLNSGAAS